MRKRWFIIPGVLLLLLLIAAGVAGHLILKSDLPRRIVDEQLDRELGLDVRIDGLDVGWLGGVTATGVAASLPLANDPVLTAPQVDVEVTPIFLIPFTGLQIQRIAANGATLTARQWSDGRWNLDEVIQTVRSRRQGGDSSDGSPWLTLPALDLTDLRVELHPADGQPVVLTGASARLNPDGGAQYEVAVDVPNVGVIEGEIARAGPWRHTMKFKLAPTPAVIAALTGQAWQTFEAAGDWNGSFAGGEVRGELALDTLRTPWADASGRLDVEAGTTVTLMPDRLTVTPFDLGQTITLAGGEVMLEDGQARVSGVTVAGYGGDVRLGGTVDPRTGDGTLAAVWQGVQIPAMTTHSGRIELTVRGASEQTPLRLEVTAQAHGETPLGRFGGQVQAAATGETWRELQANLRTTDLWLDRGSRVWRLEDMIAQLAVTPEQVRLTNLDLAKPEDDRSITAEAVYDIAQGQWRGALTAVNLGDLGLGLPLDRVSVRAVREGQVIQIVEADIAAATVQARATGSYRLGQERPLQVSINLDQVAVPSGGALDAPWVESQFFRGQVDLEGDLAPLQLAGRGGLVAVGVTLGGQPVGDVRLGLTGTVTSEQVQVVARSPELFGSQWVIRTLVGLSPLHLAVGLEAKGVQLPVLQRFVPDIPDLAGVLDLSLTADSRRLSLADAEVSGDVAIGGLQVGPFVADRLTAKLRTAADEQWLHFDDVLLTRENGRIAGSAAIAAEQLDQLQAQLTLEQWPLLFPDLVVSRIALDGNVDVSFDVPARRGTGTANIEAGLFRQDRDLGGLTMAATLNGSTLTLSQLSGQVLGGSVSGTASTNLLDLMQSSASLNVDDLIISRFEEWAGPLRAVEGAVNAKLELGRTDDPRALTPLKLTASFTANEAAFGQIRLEEGSAVAFLEPGRFVLQDLTLGAAGGTVNLWGRVTLREGAPHLYADANVTGLSLQAITNSFDAVSEAVGQLSGRITLVGRADQWRDIVGRGSVRLSDSDLGQVPLFSALFSLTRAAIRPEPQGQGGFTFSLADAKLSVSEFRYRNRGISYRLRLTLDDLWHYQDSALEGLAIMSVRPLPDLDILRAINELLITIQNDVWAVRIGGTWSAPAVGVVPLQGLENTVRTFFGSSYQ